jgi:hypothetical protein
MKLIQIYLDDETHATLVKTYTIALSAAEESFTFEDYLVYLLQAVTPCLRTRTVQSPGKETAKLKQKILRFRGKEYVEQNFIVDFECIECGKTWRAPGVYRERIYKDGTSKELDRHKPEWHCLDHPSAKVNAIETETVKEDPDLK